MATRMGGLPTNAPAIVKQPTFGFIMRMLEGSIRALLSMLSLNLSGTKSVNMKLGDQPPHDSP
jgi:hypothetical protein